MNQLKHVLLRWNRQGLAAMLTDDGLEAEGEDTVKIIRRRDAVSASDLLDAMEMKYSLLMDALVSYMAGFAASGFLLVLYAIKIILWGSGGGGGDGWMGLSVDVFDVVTAMVGWVCLWMCLMQLLLWLGGIVCGCV